MKTRVLDTPARRISIAVAVLTGLILVLAAGYAFFGGHPQPVNGPKIVAAAGAYTRILRAHQMPVPPTVTLQELVASKFLEPSDLGMLQGLDATVSLTAQNVTAGTPLLRVHMKDGTDLILRADGNIQQLSR